MQYTKDKEKRGIEMNIKKMIENLIDEIQKDGKLGAQFEKEPVKVIENILGKDLPDDIVEKIVDGVKAKISMDKASDALDMLDGALSKVLTKKGN